MLQIWWKHACIAESNCLDWTIYCLLFSMPVYFWDLRPLDSWMRGRRACPCNVSLRARFSGSTLVMVAAASSTVFTCKSPVLWGDTLAAANVTVMGSEPLIALVRDSEVGFAALAVGDKLVKVPRKRRGERGCNLVLTACDGSLHKPGKDWLQMGCILWWLDMLASVLPGTPTRLVGTLLWKVGSGTLLDVILTCISWMMIGFEALLPTSVVPFGLDDAPWDKKWDDSRKGEEMTVFPNSCDADDWKEGEVSLDGVEVEVSGALLFEAFGCVTLNDLAWF